MLHTIGSGCAGVKLSLEDNLRFLREAGFHAADILFVTGWAHIGTDELAEDEIGVGRRVERALACSGMTAEAFNAKLSVPLEMAGAEARAKRDREALAMARLMRALGVKRVSLQPTLSGDAALLARGGPAAAAELLRLSELFAQQDLLLSLEPHIMSWFCYGTRLDMLQKSHLGFPVTFDPSHLIFGGESEESLMRLGGVPAMAHLRDAAPGKLFTPFGKGTLRLDTCVNYLLRSGYDGPIAVEYISDSRMDDTMLADMALFRQATEDAIRVQRGNVV